GSPAEDSHVVFVEPEHDAQVDGDTVTVKARNDSMVVVDPIVRLVRRLEALLRDRLEAQEKRLATAARRTCNQLLVACGVGRALARPPFLERSKGAEELLRVTRIGSHFFVPKNNSAGAGRRDLADNFVD